MSTLAGADDWLGFAGFALAATTLAVDWTAALLATTIVWPWRELAGKWPVVAYLITGGPPGDTNERRVTVKGKANADALAQRWAGEIKVHGSPVTTVNPP